MQMQLQAAQPLAAARLAVAAGSAARPCAALPLRQPLRRQGRRALHVAAAQSPQEQRSAIQQRRLDTQARIDDIFDEEVKELETVSEASSSQLEAASFCQYYGPGCMFCAVNPSTQQRGHAAAVGAGGPCTRACLSVCTLPVSRGGCRGALLSSFLGKEDVLFFWITRTSLWPMPLPLPCLGGAILHPLALRPGQGCWTPPRRGSIPLPC